MAPVKLTNKTGFCFGVRRAVTMAEAALDKKRPICSLGSIIHNRQVVEELSRKGLTVIKDVKALSGKIVVISSHGISPRVARDILDKGVKIVDTTCPFVLNAQKITKRLSEDGYNVIIVGDARHPEVRALVDFAPGNAIVVKNKEDVKALKLSHNDRIGIISQTTQSTSNFLDVVREISSYKPKELKVINTICNDAEERQGSARKIAKMVDLMLVVGGKDSANTKRLFEVCREISNNTHLIETERQLKDEWFGSGKVVGITSGASTPDWVIKKIVDKIKKKGVA